VLMVATTGGWSSPWEPKAATMAAWWLDASGNARGDELDSFYRHSCLGEGVTTVHGMGTARRWCCARRTAATP
jgi:hypothetical protein